jgi:hypothetical protein
MSKLKDFQTALHSILNQRSPKGVLLSKNVDMYMGRMFGRQYSLEALPKINELESADARLEFTNVICNVTQRDNQFKINKSV